jgi:hypothetical protein
MRCFLLLNPRRLPCTNFDSDLVQNSSPEERTISPRYDAQATVTPEEHRHNGAAVLARRWEAVGVVPQESDAAFSIDA